MIRQTQFAHELLADVVRPGETVVDATAGNGFDTTFLARLVGPTGRVFAFDIQPAAIAATAGAVEDMGFSHVTVVQDDHAKLSDHVTGPIAAMTMNLGYLPGGDDHGIVTRPETTVQALRSALALLRPGGLITVVCYVGHPIGQDETAAVLALGWSLDQNLFRVDWRIEPAPLAPRLCIIRRRETS